MGSILLYLAEGWMIVRTSRQHKGTQIVSTMWIDMSCQDFIQFVVFPSVSGTEQIEVKSKLFALEYTGHLEIMSCFSLVSVASLLGNT